jgi:hypothetical protein
MYVVSLQRGCFSPHCRIKRRDSSFMRDIRKQLLHFERTERNISFDLISFICVRVAELIRGK